LAQLDSVTYIHLGLLVGGPDESTDESKIRRHAPRPRLHRKAGQYLAFIYTYSNMFRRPPAKTDMQRHFHVSPPSVHQMVVTRERNGLIRRQPDAPRSIELLVAPEHLPILAWLQINPSKSP
jgi:hypothetical protein